MWKVNNERTMPMTTGKVGSVKLTWVFGSCELKIKYFSYSASYESPKKILSEFMDVEFVVQSIIYVCHVSPVYVVLLHLQNIRSILLCSIYNMQRTFNLVLCVKIIPL